MSWEQDSDYPRPQFRRANWVSLNGPCKFTFDDARQFSQPADIKSWSQEITVPFAPETPAFDIAVTSFHHVCWYEREFQLLPAPNPDMSSGPRFHLHFGAVDYVARVWVNGHFQGVHEGGRVPFSFDVTDSLSATGVQTVTVKVEDDPLDLAKPRGKQDWQLEPHSIWYPPTTGIWQTV